MKKLFLIFCILFYTLSFAGSIPSELNDNMNSFSTVMMWAMKIGGVACVIIPIYLLATNKLQGAVASTILTIIIVVGAALFGVSWYLGKQQSVASNVGSGFNLHSISKSNSQIREAK